MHPRTREILDHLDRCHLELERAVADIPRTAEKTRPAPDRWSVAEVVEHLAHVEARIGGVLAPALTAAAGEEGEPELETSPVVPTLDTARLLDRSQRLAAGEASQPSQGLDLDAAWATLSEHRDSLRRAVVGAQGRALGSVTISHPRIGELNVYQWLVFVGAHQARHTAQVHEIAAELKRG